MDRRNMVSLGEQKALAFAATEWWKDKTHREIAEIQMSVSELVCPFSVFHEAVEKTLGRPVYTHEFAFFELLSAELYGERAAPSFEEVVGLLGNKVLLVQGE